MRENKNLLYKITIYNGIPVVDIIPADVDHPANLCAYNKKGTTIHA